MALVNPNIAMGARPLEIPQRNVLAEAAQVMNLQQAQMQMEKLRQTDEAIERIRQAAVKNGGPGDLNEIAQAFLQSPDLGHQQLGLKIREQQREKQEFETMGRKLYPQLFGAAPAAAPAAAPMAPTQPGALGSGTFDITPAPATNALAPALAAPTNQLTPATPAAAPAVNALAAPGAAQQLSPSGKTRQELEGLIFMAQRNPLFKGMAETAKLELQEMMKTPADVATMNALSIPITEAGFTKFQRLKENPGEFARTLDRLDLPPAQRRAIEMQYAQKLATHAPGTTVQLPPQEKAFEAELGKGQAERLIKSQAAAQDAAAIIDTVKTGRDIMKSGMITGAGANFLVNLNQALKTAGIDAGYADASANSQAFAANMASNVGKLIKQFGAGTGLSNADREYAEAMAGGKITLDPKAITKILDINEKASRNVIARHNKDVKGVKTNIPLEVEMPPEAPTAPAIAAPAAAIEYLRANPTMRGAFDAKYGAGAAARALGGQ